MRKQLFLDKAKRSQRVSFLLVVIIVAGTGIYLLHSSHAATPSASINATSGVSANGAAAQTCGGAGNGQCVTFACQQATPNKITPVVVGHQLNLGNTGNRLKMRGTAVWGIKDSTTQSNDLNGQSFGVDEYNNRQKIVNTIQAWGGNEIRLRVMASDYNSQTFMSKAQELQEIKDWQATAQAAGLYLSVVWWDSLDGPSGGSNWATQYSNAFPMMTDVVNALGANNPWVFYEPFNEPDNISESAWLAAMKATEQHFRADCYTGILVLDTDGWSHAYNDTDMTALETNDASLPGMNGKNQIIFAKHDYANEGYANPDSGFDSSRWPNNSNGTTTWNFTKHLVWETEFGNYNGSTSTVHLAWSAGAATWMADKVNDGTLVGATAFLYGPWLDANAITTTDNVTPTTWGGYVKTNFLTRISQAP